jgi:hypothetical protein
VPKWLPATYYASCITFYGGGRTSSFQTCLAHRLSTLETRRNSSHKVLVITETTTLCLIIVALSFGNSTQDTMSDNSNNDTSEIVDSPTDPAFWCFLRRSSLCIYYNNRCQQCLVSSSGEWSQLKRCNLQFLILLNRRWFELKSPPSLLHFLASFCGIYILHFKRGSNLI